MAWEKLVTRSWRCCLYCFPTGFSFFFLLFYFFTDLTFPHICIRKIHCSNVYFTRFLESALPRTYEQTFSLKWPNGDDVERPLSRCRTERQWSTATTNSTRWVSQSEERSQMRIFVQHLLAKFDCEVTEGRSEWSNLNIAALTFNTFSFYFCSLTA